MPAISEFHANDSSPSQALDKFLNTSQLDFVS